MNRLSLLTIVCFCLLSACQAPKTMSKGPFEVDHIDGAKLHTLDGKTITIPGIGQADQVTYFLVRHAEKATEGGSDPRLNEQGTTRADKLAKILAKVPMDKVYSSNYHRTKDTARPLTTKQGLTISDYDPRNQAAHFDPKLKAHQGETILVVGHSNTIPQLINLLLGEEKYATLAHEAYDDLFIVRSKGSNKAEVMELKY